MELPNDGVAMLIGLLVGLYMLTAPMVLALPSRGSPAADVGVRLVIWITSPVLLVYCVARDLYRLVRAKR